MSTPSMNTFGEKVRVLRHKCGMEQKTLAGLIFTSRFVISAFENGKRIPTLEEQKLIADALGVDQSFLMEADIHDLETKQLMTYSKKMSHQTLRRVNNIMEVIVEGKK